jgi:glycosyltransferase involved in cell wall biosynthesis
MNSLVIIPAFNEEMNLASVLGAVKATLPDYDIVVVNDGSKDRTKEVAYAAGADVVSHPVNIGYGAAVQTGFKYACKKGYALVVLLDADGQHDPNDAPSLVRTLQDRSVDMVIGSRFMVNNGYKTTFARFVGRNLFSLLTYLITHKNFLDITSGFQVLNGQAVAFLSRSYPVDYPDAEVIILMLLNGFRITEAPAAFRQRTKGQSMFSLPRKIYYPFKGLLAILIVLMREALKTKER